MTNGDLLNLITTHAKNYRKDAAKSVLRNNHMNDIAKSDKIPQKVIDALLVDFVNFVGMQHCMDWGLYTIDLQTSENLKYWEKELMFSNLRMQFAHQLKGIYNGDEIFYYRNDFKTFYIDFPRNEKGKKTGKNIMLFYCLNSKDFVNDKWKSIPVPQGIKELESKLIELGFKIE